MTRSVINAMVAAAVLSTGVGLGVVPAAAEPGEPGVVKGTASTESNGEGSNGEGSNGEGSKGEGGRGEAGRRSHVPGRRPIRIDRQSRPDRGQIWPWPCYDWGCMRYKNRNRRGGGIVGIQAAVPPGARTPQSLPFAPVAETEPRLDVAALQAQAPQALPPLAAAVAPPPAVSPAATAPRTPVRAVPPAPVRSLPPPAAAPAVTVALPPPQAPVSEPADSLRLGYPEELRNADFRRLVSLALPGLAAIAGMTALGGMFGYRQAKAGYVLRTAGAGRFLQS